MTRILYWNIDQFNFNKIADPSDEASDIPTLTKAQKAQGMLAYIKAHLVVADADDAPAKPDIIVVVEIPVADTYTARGRLTTGSGPDGVRQLLTEIRAKTQNDQWMLVPPLQTGEKEVVAVYYDSTNYVFTGPWQWPGGDTGPAFNPLGPEPPANGYYAEAYKQTLKDRTIPDGSLYNKDVSEQKVAAATDFKYAVGNDQAGTAVDFGTARAPYWVSFAQLQDGSVARNISLFAIHGPNSDESAGPYLEKLAKIAEIVDDIKEKEVRIVLGDFNLNLFMSTAGLPIVPAYDPMKAKYTFGIKCPDDPPPDPLKGYKGFFATFLKRTQNASYWVVGPAGDFYPGYGYFGSYNKSNFYCPDNIMALYGTNAGAPMKNGTMLNGVVGSTYALHPLPPAPNGTYKFPIALASPTFAAPPEKAPPNNQPPDRITLFREWRNYKHIYETSDHMAIIADI